MRKKKNKLDLRQKTRKSEKIKNRKLSFKKFRINKKLNLVKDINFEQKNEESY